MMGAYQYSALKHSGSTSKGVIEADSPSHARQLLRQQGLIPTHVQASSKNLHANRVSKNRQFKTKDLTLFTRQLATLLSASIPLDEALRGVIDQSQKSHVQQLVIGVRSKVLEGYGLAQALGEYPHAFPELYRATVAAGEQTGSLDDVLNKLADYTEHQQETQQKIQQALIYPTLMLVISITIIAFLLAFVVPKIIAVFAGSGQELPTATRILIALSEGIQSWGLYLIAGVVTLIMLFKRALHIPRINLRWHQILLQTPGINHLIITTNVARYSHTFAILFAAGVSVLEAMRVGTSLITNLIMREKFELATTHVKEGMPISQALRKTSFFTPMATHLMASGEKSGKIAELMERTAVYLDREIRRLVDTALTLLEPLVILFMGAIIMFIVLATLLPIFSMEQLVS